MIHKNTFGIILKYTDTATWAALRLCCRNFARWHYVTWQQLHYQAYVINKFTQVCERLPLCNSAEIYTPINNPCKLCIQTVLPLIMNENRFDTFHLVIALARKNPNNICINLVLNYYGLNITYDDYVICEKLDSLLVSAYIAEHLANITVNFLAKCGVKHFASIAHLFGSGTYMKLIL